MILYELNCSHDHSFSAWFNSSAAFDEQRDRQLVACPICEDTCVAKAPMAPRIGKVQAADASTPAPALPLATATHASGEISRMIGEFCRAIETNCDYVGGSFAEEARKIHYGEADPRGIYGEASNSEAADLKEEGIEIASVPWIRKPDA
jgi:hypothetical protein